jgi:hypothetical protein
MKLDRKSLLPASVPLCLLLILSLNIWAQEGSTISGRVLIQDDRDGFVEPGEKIRVHFKGPNKNSFVRTTMTNGEFNVPVNDLGVWWVTAKKSGYSQTNPRPVLVQVNDKKKTSTDPRDLRLEKPKPSPTPATGNSTTELVLVLYQAPQAPPREKAAPQCKEAQRQGRLMHLSEPLADVEIDISVNNSESGKIEDYLTIRTNKNGRYDFALPEKKEYDEYILTIEDVGFKPYTLFLDRNECLPDIIYLETKTEVSDEGKRLSEIDEATRRQVFSPEVMQSLPVPGVRNFDAFALLAPGVLPPPESLNPIGPGVSPGLGVPGQFAVNGLRSRENNFTVDGSDNNDEDIGTRRQGFLLVTPQSIESLQEFQVITAVGDARFGRNAGGQVNAVTKSGTNGVHGSLYGFFSSSRFNARNFFDQKTNNGTSVFPIRRSIDGAPVLLDGKPLTTSYDAGNKDPMTHAQAGFTVGGPITPKVGFFFASLEQQIIRGRKETHFAVPTVRERGVFGTGETGLLADQSPLPQANRFRLFPSSVPGNALFSLYPFPNNPLGPYDDKTYSTELPANGFGVQVSGKIEWRFGDSPSEPKRNFWSVLTDGDILRLRYNLTQDRRTIPTVGEALFSSVRTRVRTQNFSLLLNRSLTPRTSDAIRVSFGRTRLFFFEVRDPFLSPSPLFPEVPFLLNAPLLLNVTAPNLNGTLNPTTYFSAKSQQGSALLNSLGYTSITQAEQITGPLGEVLIPGFSPLGVDIYNFPQTRANNTFQVGDTVLYTHGSKVSIFGVDVRKVQINSSVERGFRPRAVFNWLRSEAASSLLRFRAPEGTPVSRSDFSGPTLAAIGLPTGLFHTLAVVPNSSLGARFTQVNVFAQNQWRFSKFFFSENQAPTRNMQLTVGLRYQLNTVPDTVGKRLENALDPEKLRTEAAQVAAQCNTADTGNPSVGRCTDLVAALSSAFPADFKVSFGADRNDLDFRLGYVVDVLGDGRLVVRAGFGTYSGQVLGIVIGQSRSAFPDFLPLNLSALPPSAGSTAFLYNLANPLVRQLNPSLNLLAPGTLNTLRTNPIEFLVTRVVPPGLNFDPTITGLDLVLPQREIATPFSMQYAFTTEWQFTKRYLVGVSYVGTRGIKLLRVATPDLGLNRQFSDTDRLNAVQSTPSAPFPLFSGSIQLPQSAVISKAFVVARTFFESKASSNYNSLQIEIRKRHSNRLYFGTALTYSHSIDDASDIFDLAGSFALPQNSRQRSERGPSNYDVRWRSVTYFVKEYLNDFPFQKVGKGLGGWQISGTLTAQTGQPYTVNTAFDINRDGNLTDRLDTTSGLIQDPVQGDRRFQLGLVPGLNTFSLLAKDGLDGAVGRNTFRAPGIINFDVSLSKYLIRKEHQSCYFRTEIFNLFNRAQFGIPVRILESPAFGTSVRTIMPARTIQFAIKYSF